MTNLTAQSILFRLKETTDDEEIQDAIDIAISAIEKRIQNRPIIKSNYSPALCPSCKIELSDHLGDGYYKHYYSKSICECGQKLRWIEY